MSSSNSSSGGSQIKGGGRAALSDTSEAALIDCLMNRKRHRHRQQRRDGPSSILSDGNDKDEGGGQEDLSAHERKRERKRFVKQLVERYEREKIYQQLNGCSYSSRASSAAASSSSSSITAGSASSFSVSNAPSSITGVGSAAGVENIIDNVIGKVRVELVEAIFEDDGKDFNKKNKSQKEKTGKKSSSHNKTSLPFKVGTKKVVVLPRATTIPQILQQAQKKLNMKNSKTNKPVRVFVYYDGGNEIVSQQQEVNLETNLARIEDGTCLYVTASSTCGSQPQLQPQQAPHNNNDENGTTTTNSNDDGTTDNNGPSESSSMVVDPLAAVKQAYYSQQQQGRSHQYPRNRRHSQQQQQQQQPSSSSQHHPSLPVPHPTFSDHFESLPALSESCTQLPAAACREEILQAVQDHRVVVICGATGCGKSTQVPQFLWQGMLASQQPAQSTKPSHAQILVTQPRRVAATALARRVSQEMKSPMPGKPGSLVGHHVRLDRAIAQTAQIIYCTVGILLRRLTSPHPIISATTTTTSEDEEASKESLPAPAIPLSDITHVVVDEVHERDVQTDFLLTLLRGVVLPRNPHLRVILMSATASSQLFVDYFSSSATLQSPPKVLSIPGRTFPVETMWLEDCQRLAGKSIRNYHDHLQKKEEDEKLENRRNRGGGTKSEEDPTGGSDDTIPLSPRATDIIDYDFIRSLIASIVRKQQQSPDGHFTTSADSDRRSRTSGAILVFLPGKGEIEALFRILTRGTNKKNEDDDDDSPSLVISNSGSKKDAFQIYKLHSGIPRGSQEAIFQPAPVGSVKIILATNIAETSITIPDVSHVIDSGRVKESRYNASSRIKELVTVWTSQASALQRAGRAGRTTAGVCYKLYSQAFSDRYLPAQTPPEMVRTPLDELILQLCLLYEQRRDELPSSSLAKFPKGANPFRFLSQVPEPPPRASLEQACQHLLDVDALHVVDIVEQQDEEDSTSPTLLYRLTPLGFHLSRLPMDAKVGKTLIVGCILECLEGALTIAATLSCSKSCFYSQHMVDRDYELAVEARARLIEGGFGGKDWRGGTVKGDLIAAIACYREWAKRSSDKARFEFACKNALDHVALKEIQELRRQYLDLLVDAGFVPPSSQNSSKQKQRVLPQNQFQDDALLTSCCLVAGMYPNVCTLMRPRRGGPKGGRLLTKEGDVCRPQMQSFQRVRVQKAAETGKDAYAVYHTKHQSLGTGNRPGEVFLNEVNFVSRYALLLFSGELEIVKNAIVLDGWLKFKIGDKSVAGAVLLLALREELDQRLLHQISNGGNNCSNGDDDDQKAEQDEEDSTNELMNVVRQLLTEE